MPTYPEPQVLGLPDEDRADVQERAPQMRLVTVITVLDLKLKKNSDYFLKVLEMLGGRVQTFLRLLIHNVRL